MRTGLPWRTRKIRYATSLGLATTGPNGVGLLLAALFGGLSFALYPLCVAHTNDHLSAEQRVAASGGLVLVYSLGSACGPLLVSGAMSAAGPVALFVSIGLLAAILFLFGMWRQWVGPAVPANMQRAYQILPRTTPISASLDPLAPGVVPEFITRTNR